MNVFKNASLCAVVLMAGVAVQAEEAKTRSSAVNISTAIIPSGFDNSEPVAIVSGLFPNSCYKWEKTEVTHVDALTHEVKSFAQIRDGYCLMVMLPFSEEVALGKFETGTHKIKFVNADGSYIEKTLDVE
jgi:hypothetical protein